MRFFSAYADSRYFARSLIGRPLGGEKGGFPEICRFFV